MNWIPNNHKPQLSVACPPRFRGNRAYVSQSESRRGKSNPPVLNNAMPFGKHKNKPIGGIPTSYLKWAIENISGRQLLLDAIRAELAAREESGDAT
jgi:hypothetical protein